MNNMKKAVSAEICIPITSDTCPPSRLFCNGIQLEAFYPRDFGDVPGILDEMETVAGYRHAGFWIEANSARFPEEDPIVETQTWIYHFYDSAPF